MLAVVALAAATAGCAAIFPGRFARSGLTNDDDRLRRLLASGQALTIYRGLEAGESAPADELLRLLYAGTAGHYAGEYLESSRHLDAAAALSEDRVTHRLGAEALSLLTNDLVRPYRPSRTERLFIHYYAALNYLRADDLDGAAVEARRISRLLDGYDDGRAPRDYSPTSRFLRYFAGTIFEVAGEWADAEVAFRHAGALAARLGHGPDLATGTGTAEGGGVLAVASFDAASDAGPAPPPPATPTTRDRELGEVVVLLERGFVPHLAEQELVVTIPGRTARWLSAGGAGDRISVATVIADHIAGQLTPGPAGGAGYRDRRHITLAESRWDDHALSGSGVPDDASNPYVMRIAWPVFRDAGRRTDPADILVDGRSVGRTLATDVGAAVVRDFEGERVERLARTVARAATKLALTRVVEQEVGEKDEVAGEVLGLVTNAVTALAERADTRCWHFLPGAVELLRLHLPPGRHEVAVRDRSGARTELGPVTVRAGGVHVVSGRLW